jgi:hypothetical protein
MAMCRARLVTRVTGMSFQQILFDTLELSFDLDQTAPTTAVVDRSALTGGAADR